MIKIKTITTAIKPYIIRSTATALLALALVTACTPHAADDPAAAAHPVPLMPTVTIAQPTTATVSRLSSSSEEEYPDRGEVVGKATRITTRANAVDITLLGSGSETLQLTMDNTTQPYTLTGEGGALTSTTPHVVTAAGTYNFSVDEAKVAASIAPPTIAGITTDPGKALSMNLKVAMAQQPIAVAANGAVRLPLAPTTAALRLILKTDAGVSLSTVLSLLSGEEAPMQDTPEINTASRIVTLPATTGGTADQATTHAVAFGMLPPATTIKAGELLALINIDDNSGGSSTSSILTTKTLALTAPATLPAPLNAGDMLTYTVHVNHSLATITGVSITGFEAGNGESGEDIVTGNKDTAIATGLETNLAQLLTADNPVWMITGDGADVAADNLIINNVKAALNVAGPTARIHLQMPNFAGNIDNGGFADCQALASVHLPEVTSIGKRAFQDCKALISVHLPNATTILGAAFISCTALTSVNLPVATEIGGQAFAGCKALASVSLPLVKSLGENAFQFCQALTSVHLPEVTSIGNGAFQDCKALISVHLPNATTISGAAFISCTALTSVNLPVATEIGGQAFDGCTVLTTISLPAAITINQMAFLNCTALTTVSLPAAIKFDRLVFENCAALTRLELTQSTEKITMDKEAFIGTTTDVTFTLVLHSPEALATIGARVEDSTDTNPDGSKKKKVTFLYGTTTDVTFTFAAVEYLSS